MTIDLTDPLLGGLFMIFVLAWGTGFVLRVISNPSGWSNVDPVAMPAYRQIRVSGPLRWLFGYMPVTGPVSMIGALFQLAAYLTVGITTVLAWIWPDVFHALYWLPIVILVLTMLLTLRFLIWLWNKQQGEK